MSHTIQRAFLTVADVTYPLASMEHVDVLKAAIRDAARSGGDFVEIPLDAGRRVSIFATIASVIFITVDIVEVGVGAENGEEATDCSTASPGMYDVDTSFDVI